MARPRRDLSRTEILHAALTLAEADGVEALTMSKIGKAVNVEAMSLYRHISNKDDVLDGIVDVVLRQLEIPPRTGDWIADASAFAGSFRRLATRYPHTAVLVLTRPQSSPTYLAAADAGLDILRRAGLSVGDAVRALRALLAYVIGTLLREVGASPGLHAPDSSEAATQIAALLANPAAPRVVEAAAQLAVMDHGAEFEFGLRLLLRSLDELISSSS